MQKILNCVGAMKWLVSHVLLSKTNYGIVTQKLILGVFVINDRKLCFVGRCEPHIIYKNL